MGFFIVNVYVVVYIFREGSTYSEGRGH